MPDFEYIPAKQRTVYLDKQMFATIICMIPAGELTTLDAIYKVQARRKGADRCEIENGGIMPLDKRMFWTPADVQPMDFITELKDYGKADTDSRNPNKRVYRVQNYKAALFDLNKLIIKE